MNVKKTDNEVYRIDISLGDKTICFDPQEGYSLSNKTVEGIRRVIAKRNDSSQKKDAKRESMTTGLKTKMSYQEMEEHMRKNSFKNPNRVNVGLYAKRLGYEVYKPMIHGRVYHFYVNESRQEELIIRQLK